MTVSSTASRWEYNGDGATVAFQYDNVIFAASDLKVYAGAPLALQTLNTHYTVTGVGETTGGNVVFVAAPAVGIKNVLILRDVPATQDVKFPEGNPIPSSSLSKGLDKLTVLIQQLLGATSRKLGLASTSAYAGSLDLPDPVAGRSLKWAPDGLSIINSDSDPDAIVALASASADAATTQVGIATAKAADADASADAAAALAVLSSQWATKTDAPVSGGEWSAKKHAQDAAVSAADALAAVGGVKVTANDTTADKLGVKITVSAGLSKAVTSPGADERFNLSIDIAGLPHDATPDTADDYLMSWDVSAGAFKKVLMSSVASTANYFGTGADGDATIAADTTWASDTGVNDTGVVVKNFNNLTINSGVTVTAAQRAKCMLVYVKGDLTLNGTLHMDGKGAAGAVSSDIAITKKVADAILSAETADTVFRCVATGGAGGTASATSSDAGHAGGTATNGTGGGGGGGAGGVTPGGAGSAGTAWCGGSGGGGGANGVSGAATSAAANGGAGGNGGNCTGYAGSLGGGGGGAGNPGGTGGAPGSSGTVGQTPPGGGGGTLILIVRGNVTIGGAGAIKANGTDGGNSGTGTYSSGGGGGAGGGRIIVLYGGTYTNSGTVQANGGAGGALGGTASGSAAGGAGGAGAITTNKISAT